MPCDQLDDFLDGRLSEPERVTFAEHVTVCDRCRAAIAELRKIETLLAVADGELGIASAELKQRIARCAPSETSLRWAPARAISALAAAVTAAGILWWASSRLAAPGVRPPTADMDSAKLAHIEPDQAAREPLGRPSAPLVRLQFDRGPETIAVPLESSDPSVTIFWLYPAEGTLQTSDNPKSDSSKS
jgi:anti-sigma factor RsiW